MSVLFYLVGLYISEACIGVCGIKVICLFTSCNIGYHPFNFQVYGILCSLFVLLSGKLNS